MFSRAQNRSSIAARLAPSAGDTSHEEIVDSVYLLVYCRPGDLIFAWPGVIVLAMTFGGFEMWRIAPRRTPGRRAALVLWAVFASLFVVWAVKAVAIPWWEKGPNVPLKLERVNADAVASVWGERWSGMSWPT